jgi:hypothetical protein
MTGCTFDRWGTLRRLQQLASRPLRRIPLQDQEDGSMLVELAVTLTVFFSLMFCFLEICLLFYSSHLSSELAREGSRYAMMRSSTCQYPNGNSCASTAAQVNSYVSSYGLPNLAGGTITPATVYSGSSNVVGNNVTVTVNYVFTISMPFVPTKSITLSSASTMPIIQ